MSSKFKKIMLSLVGLIGIIVLITTWFYPYSFLSVHKSYTFTPDPVVVDQYIRDLKEFKSSFEKDLEELTEGSNIDLTTDRTQYLLPLFEQNWLVSKKSVKMDRDDLGVILFEVENARKTLLELIAREDYTQEQRQYLVDSIKGLLSLEEEIDKIKNGNAESRKTLKTQFHNLHVSFINNFMLYTIFYERSQ